MSTERAHNRAKNEATVQTDGCVEFGPADFDEN